MERNIISVSGGKDSTALLLLAVERGAENIEPVFCDTGNEHELTYEYIQYLSEKIMPIRILKRSFSAELARKRAVMQRVINGEPDESNYPVTPERAKEILSALVETGNPMLDQAVCRGMFATSFRRFCSTELKREVLVKHQTGYCLAGDDVISWQGVRRDESAARASQIENELKTKFDNGAELWNYRPILDWKAEQCFEMHKRHNIKPNPLYLMGFSRVGCMPCIHSRKNEILEMSKRFPHHIARIAEWEALVQAAARVPEVATFFDFRPFSKTADKSKSNIHRVVEWSKTSRGGNNLDMFRSGDQVPTCSSIYGLCE